jgi:hypothetical protein
LPRSRAKTVPAITVLAGLALKGAARPFESSPNIGEQESDLDGGKEAEQRFRVPNPFYFIP